MTYFKTTKKPTKVKKILNVYLNIYPDRHPVAHWTKESADKYAEPDRIACIKVKRSYTEEVR